KSEPCGKTLRGRVLAYRQLQRRGRCSASARADFLPAYQKTESPLLADFQGLPGAFGSSARLGSTCRSLWILSPFGEHPVEGLQFLFAGDPVLYNEIDQFKQLHHRVLIVPRIQL